MKDAWLPNTVSDWIQILLVKDIYKSHTRTVVRECCKGDDESQWDIGKFDPPATQKPLNRWSPKFA